MNELLLDYDSVCTKAKKVLDTFDPNNVGYNTLIKLCADLYAIGYYADFGMDAELNILVNCEQVYLYMFNHSDITYKDIAETLDICEIDTIDLIAVGRYINYQR